MRGDRAVHLRLGKRNRVFYACGIQKTFLNTHISSATSLEAVNCENCVRTKYYKGLLSISTPKGK